MIEQPAYATGQWVPPGQPAAIGAHAIPGGLIYTGRYLRSGDGTEPALVNPDLPVAPPDGHAVDPGTGPQLAYHLLSPAARWTYLNWLSSGRRTDTPAGLVLLFCFGLERRVLLDADTDPAVRAELPAITAEVHHLRVRYGDGGPVLRGSLDNLLDLLELFTPASRPGAEVPIGRMAVRVALARHAAAATPVPAALARAWVRHHPSLPPRSVEAACPDEFDHLFALRYRDRHGAGLVPPGDVPGIRLRYQPASPGLATTLVCREDLPDVLAEPRSTRALGSLVDSVATALDPYRRWLTKFPTGRNSLAAAAHLPRELVDAAHGRLGALRVWAERQLDGSPWAVIDASDCWEFWSTAAPERMARDEAAAFLAVLTLLDLGIEPDVRFGAPPLSRGPAVLFRLARPASDRPGAHFPAAAAIARCAAVVASAARPLDPRDPLAAAVLATACDLAAALRLGPGEDIRLAARLAWLLTTRADIDRLARHTTAVTASEREVAGHWLVTVAVAADPVTGPATVAALTRVYRILGLEPDRVFHRLHERSVGGAPALPRSATRAGPLRPSADEPDGPVVVQVADATPSGYALPWAADGAPSVGVTLDRAAVTRTLAESGAAAALLHAIFHAGDEEERVIPPGIASLDPAHRALLRVLATRSSWTREEFVSLAATHRVLPGGALDRLNEAAIDTAGAPVIEDGDTLAVDDEVLREMLA